MKNTVNKSFVLVLIILFIEVVLGIYAVNWFYKEKRSLELESLYHFETFSFGGELFKYDEEYALDIAIIVYSRMYNKTFTKDDFIIESSEFEKNKNVWNVYLKKPREEFYLQNPNVLYSGRNGLFIDKTCGAIVASCGDDYN